MTRAEEGTLYERLFMVRHGESSCNVVHRIAGNLDAPLTGMGRAQATKVAGKHTGTDFDRIYVSPLSRAYDTARTIHGDDADLLVDDRLMERDFGGYTLESKSLLQKKHGIAEYEKAMNGDSTTMSGGETFAQFRDRVHDFYEEEVLPALRRGETVCVVSHKYVVELLCRFILDRPGDEAYDLRLPNSEMLRGDRIEGYVRGESKQRNMAYDWLVVHHPVVFCAGMVAGLLANLAGLRLPPLPYVLLGILVVASVITMCRIEIESSRRYLTDRGVLRSVLVRYAALPAVAALLLALLDVGGSHAWGFTAVLVATPSSVVAMTVSRCLGGMIMPAFAHVILSSLAGIVSFAAVLPVVLAHGAVAAVAISVAASTGTVLISYLLVARLRRSTPVRTAKFGERNAYLAVLLLTTFIVLVSLTIDLSSFSAYGPTAIAIAVGLRLIAFAMTRRRHVQGIDDYVAMTYPNVFVVVVIAGLTGNTDLATLAIWCLLPTFALSFFDSWYARRIAVPARDPRWFTELGIPAHRPDRAGHRRPATQ
ncbi:histidine phosphatase family protein [Amycolatopsis sp. EV170708-02-1]|uniref:histidine phosphatase family protein n=1 Tax=Amycolatopsis sp. EV170708-02-1 TaxID=2919322 RepID=UPI001F0C0608|nr:histidine phosphatase family protein [Amycolatopsis sp. EV170708-02-1]UMO99965.1 histidine phosphatase family protein [Amycolatopsis sp. EV170708-02-1]